MCVSITQITAKTKCIGLGYVGFWTWENIILHEILLHKWHLTIANMDNISTGSCVYHHFFFIYSGSTDIWYRRWREGLVWSVKVSQVIAATLTPIIQLNYFRVIRILIANDLSDSKYMFSTQVLIYTVLYFVFIYLCLFDSHVKNKNIALPYISSFSFFSKCELRQATSREDTSFLLTWN